MFYFSYLTCAIIYDIIPATTKREGALCPLMYTGGTAELESTNRVDAKNRPDLSTGGLFFLVPQSYGNRYYRNYDRDNIQIDCQYF